MKYWPILLCLMGAAVIVGSPPSAAQPKKGEKPKWNKREVRILELTNQIRKKNNLAALKMDPVLHVVGRAHSANMAKQQKLDHFLDKKGPFQRIREANYKYRHAGENVAYGSFPIEKIFQLWVNSPPHKKNLLNPNYTHIGVGCVVDSKGVAWYTQVFAKPR